MKIRDGFVSNSSSSSFLIYGIKLDANDLIDVLQDEFKKYEYDDVTNGYDVREYLECDAFDENVSLYVTSPNGYHVYIGKSWSKVGNDETGLEFKNRTINDIKSNNAIKDFIEKQDVKFETHKYAWND